jgi:hypothetical protein
MKFSMYLLTGAVLIAAAHAASPALSAEAKSATPPGFSQSAPDIPDQKLDAAATALKHIATLQQDYRQQMAKGVTDQGLSIDEYADIMEVAQNDPGVRQKILQRVGPLKDDGEGK